MDPTDPIVVSAIEKVLATAHAHGLTAAIYCISLDYANAMFAKGFDLVTIASDAGLIAAGAANVRRQIKP
jgi:4-hydroxy-2-oxoheptanedioate aldolase